MRNPNIADEIIAMLRVDQDMRRRNLDDRDYWDDCVDRKHTSRMKELVAQIGWPSISKVGHEGSSAAWLLVQHADHDVEFQKQCLALMKLVHEGDIDRGDIAYLEDRIRVNCHERQLYGTQFNEVDGKSVLREIEDPERVDERRLQMGLGTLQEGIEQMHEKYRNK